LVGALVISVAALFAVFFHNASDPKLIGLALTYAVSLSEALNWLVRMVRSHSPVSTATATIKNLANY
jgi:hypothetical protein